VPLGPDGKFQVLFVCTGNLCRSPMAEGLLKQKLTGHLKKKVRVVSAGTDALEGFPPTLRGLHAAAFYRVDLSHHRSQPVTPWLLQHSDLILVMERGHFDTIQRLDPGAAPRTYLLKEYSLPSEHSGGILSIEDPISGDESVYMEVYQELDEEMNRILPYIEKAATSVG
jgi:protein-tyrosine-phosphatase